MVQLRDEQPLVLLSPLAIRNVYVDADHALCASIVGVGTEGARLDPADGAIWAKNAILRFVLAAPLSDGVVAACIEPPEIIGVYAGAPLLHCSLRRSLG